MKNEDSFDEIAAALRSAKPDPQPSPGLESRILRSLALHRDHKKKPEKASLWFWFLLPSTAAIAITLAVLRLPGPAAPASTVAIEAPAPAFALPEAPDSPFFGPNPLETETIALRRDAKRVGDFLIGSLPSLESITR